MTSETQVLCLGTRAIAKRFSEHLRTLTEKLIVCPEGYMPNRSIYFASGQVSRAPRPATNRRDQALFHQESIGMKSPNHYVDAVPTLHHPTAVRERHPVRLACLGCAALAQLPHLFQRRDHQLDAGLRVDQGRLGLLVVERLGLFRV